MNVCTIPNTNFKANRRATANGIEIIIRPSGIEVNDLNEKGINRALRAETWRAGRLIGSYHFSSLSGFKFSSPFINVTQCGVIVKDNCQLLAQLDVEQDLFPFVRLQVPQFHITESYVSVPPALTITDERGDVWTLGFTTAPKNQSPKGEFAFNILRNGYDTGEIGSRIERRNGKVRVFTKMGWKTWNGNTFF